MWAQLLFGVAIGAFLATGFGLLTVKAPSLARLAGAGLMVTAAGHAVDSWLLLEPGAPHQIVIFWFLSAMASPMAWLFVQTLFADAAKWRWKLAAPVAVCAVLALIGRWGPQEQQPIFWFLYGIAVIALMVHACWVIFAGRQGDLVEPRRRLRTPILVAMAIYVVLNQWGDLTDLFGARQQLGGLGSRALALSALALAGAALMLRADPVLLDPAQKVVAAPPGIDPADKALAGRLETAMSVEEIWKREALSIADLAAHLGCPEHRLRALINTQLGHRNFAAFINSRRIAAAQGAMLAEPRKPVSAIAFDHGFASLGPFNRAFKDETGLTPTEWRRQKLAESAKDLPIPEKSA